MNKTNHFHPSLIMVLLLLTPIFLSACIISDAVMYTFETIQGKMAFFSSWQDRNGELPKDLQSDIVESIVDAEKEIRTEKEIQTQIEAQIEATVETQLIEGFSEEEVLLPNEPITYQGDVNGVSVSLVIDFKSADVSGALSLVGDDYADAEIIGVIDLVTLNVTAVFSGKTGSVEYGMSFPWSGIIDGIVSPDLSSFTGQLVDDEGEVHEVKLQR